MKKLYSGILCLFIVLISVLPASAAVKPNVVLETGRVIDELFPVYVNLVNCKGLTACDMTIAFNTQAVTFEYCEQGSDAVELSKTVSEEMSYVINNSSKAGVRISFFFKESLLTAEEYAADAKINMTVNVNTEKFQAFVLWFSVPEDATDTANFIVSARLDRVKKGESEFVGNLSFKPSELPVYIPVRGDVNLDSLVTSEDARLALRCAVKLETLSKRPFLNADMDSDGAITSADARRILRVAVKLPED